MRRATRTPEPLAVPRSLPSVRERAPTLPQDDDVAT